MRLNFTLTLILFCSLLSQARYVEFAVNMNNDTVSVNGIHVTGDFQTAAGFAGGNWNPASTVMTQIGTTGIYHVIVNIPAKKKYEFKYVNGDQFYETEYVPEESRVGYLFNDNRWIYIDSLANDTLMMPAIIFSTNAPLTKKLLRFKVGMTNFIIQPTGVHVAGSFNSFDTKAAYMYSFDGKIYEYITYVDTLTSSVQYRFLNGNNNDDYEVVPAACKTGSNRSVSFTKDTMLSVVCFSSCSACLNGINGYSNVHHLSIEPNPFNSSAQLNFGDEHLRDVQIFDALGRCVRSYNNNYGMLTVEKRELSPGVYFLTTSLGEKVKLIIN